jgi:hypothetical protein
VKCESSPCAKHMSSWEGFSSYDLTTLFKSIERKKTTYDIIVYSGRRIPIQRNHG